MQPDAAKHLEDIREAGQTVLEVTSGKRLADYLAGLHHLGDVATPFLKRSLRSVTLNAVISDPGRCCAASPGR
jgi:hypothetical protein